MEKKTNWFSQFWCQKFWSVRDSNFWKNWSEFWLLKELKESWQKFPMYPQKSPIYPQNTALWIWLLKDLEESWQKFWLVKELKESWKEFWLFKYLKASQNICLATKNQKFTIVWYSAMHKVSGFLVGFQQTFLQVRNSQKPKHPHSKAKTSPKCDPSVLSRVVGQMYMALLQIHRAVFCGYIGLFCGYIGLFCATAPYIDNKPCIYLQILTSTKLDRDDLWFQTPHISIESEYPIPYYSRISKSALFEGPFATWPALTSTYLIFH